MNIKNKIGSNVFTSCTFVKTKVSWSWVGIHRRNKIFYFDRIKLNYIYFASLVGLMIWKHLKLDFKMAPNVWNFFSKISVKLIY